MASRTQTTPTGAAIRYGRNLTGLTREELAEQLGGDWSVHKIGNYERGQTGPTLAQAVELADALDLPLGVIAYGLEWSGRQGVTPR